jgi:ribosomal protein S12 methylthiotransferase
MDMKRYKVALISLGCAKNLVNSEQMLYLLDEAGMDIVPTPEQAQVCIVNTCGFIDSAKMEAIENILRLGELKKAGQLQKIIVTGCLSERYRQELTEEMPEIDGIMGVANYGDIVQAVCAVMEEGAFCRYGDKNAPVEELGRVLSTGPAWGYLRIAEGCDNCCAYCIIPKIRGRFRSRTMEDVVSEAQALAESGVQELIVIAQDITRYGLDLYGRRSLDVLLEKFCQVEGIRWIRLHYLYPDETDDRLIDVIAREPKILKYLDLPIQHISDSVLKRMNRRGTGQEIRALFAKLRARIPGLVLRTSLITGLPGEGEAEFEELCAFLRAAKIERAGVFPYSPEEGTPAYTMPRVDEETAQRRAALVGDIQEQIMQAYDESRLGTTETVLCCGLDEEAGCLWGRSYAESPDVDGRILFSGDAQPGTFVPVQLTGFLDGELYGTQL